MGTLEGKTALVTGGGKGIGRAIALALSARGVRVVVTGRHERSLGETVGEIAHGGGKARHVAGDVRDPVHLAAAAARAVDVFGSLDFVIANASPPSSADGEAILQTNLIGAYYTFTAALRCMAGPGHLLAVSRAGGLGSAQAASDAGVFALCRSLAEELAPRKISCGCVVVTPSVAEEEIAQEIVALCGSSWSCRESRGEQGQEQQQEREF